MKFNKNGTHAWNIVVIANTLGQQPVPDLPCENRRTLPLELGDLVHHRRRGHPGLGAADGPRLDGARLVVPVITTLISQT